MGKVFGTHVFCSSTLYNFMLVSLICTIAFTASRRRNPATNSARTYMTRLLNRFMSNIVEQFGEKRDHIFACSEGYPGWRSTAQTGFKMSLNRPCWIVALVMKRSEAPKYTCQDSEEGILEQFTLEESIGFFWNRSSKTLRFCCFRMLPTLLRKKLWRRCSTVSRQAFSTDGLTGIHCSANTHVQWRTLWTSPKQALRIFTVRWAAQSDELLTCLEMPREVDPLFASFFKWPQWMTMNRFPSWAWYTGSACCHIALDLCLFLGLSDFFWRISRFYGPPGTGKTTVASHL